MESSTVDYYNERWHKENQWGAPPNPERVGRVVEHVLAAMASHESQAIIDVGCGNGWILAHLEKALAGRGRLHGIEPAPAGVQNSRTRVPTADVRVGSIESSDFGKPFDITVCSEVIEHVSDQAAFMQGLARTLRPGGTLILTTPNSRYRGEYFDRCLPRPVAQPVENWLSARTIDVLSGNSFFLQSLETFDLSYFYHRHPRLATVRDACRHVPGGWRSWQAIDGFLCRRYRAGLYWLAVLIKR